MRMTSWMCSSFWQFIVLAAMVVMGSSWVSDEDDFVQATSFLGVMAHHAQSRDQQWLILHSPEDDTSVKSQ